VHSPPVDITGIGLVCCLGTGAEAVYGAMCDGACGFRTIDRFPNGLYPQQQAGQLPPETEDRLRDAFPEEDIAGAMVVTAGREALEQAGLNSARSDPRLGLVLGTNFGPMETLEWCWRERVDLGTLDTETFAIWQKFVYRMAELLGCGGPRTQISLSCASGAATAALAADWVRTGAADRVLAVGYDALTEYCWCGLTNLRTITTDTVRPFDRRRSGTLFSEGAAAMLLERRAARPTDGRAALACLAGAATNNNAFHMTAPAKNGDGSRRVMAAALQDAGCAPACVQHICAHATGTAANDTTEAAALRGLFGERLEHMTVAAHKSQFGHMMGAAGLAEAVVTVQVLRHGIVPPTIHSEEPDPACRLDCVRGEARKRTVHWALTNSAGLGGNNAALLLRAPQPQRPEGPRQ